METLKKMMLLVVLVLTTNALAYTDRSGDNSSSLPNKSTKEYLMTALGQTSFDSKKVTHIIVVGSGMKEDSDQFYQTGLLQGYKYREMYPQHQVVVISAPDVRGADNDEVLQRFNLSIIKKVNATLNTQNLVNEMLFFNKIASFDFYGHSSPWAVKLAKKDGTIMPKSHKALLEKVIPKFTDYAYATLNGCNGGFQLAPRLSTVWKIPVSGSLTSTQFERLQNDGWYKKSDRTEAENLRVNTLSFKQPMDCKMGVCWRLKTARKNYSSYWGKFEDGGLSFPKFFCNFDNSNKRCEKSMALHLTAFPSVKAIDKNSSIEDYKVVLFDYLCSTAKDKNYFKKCVDGINNAINNNSTTFQIHPGNALECNFKTCNASIKCKKKIFGRGPRAGSCKVVTEPNTNPTTLVREFKAFIQGYKLIH